MTKCLAGCSDMVDDGLIYFLPYHASPSPKVKVENPSCYISCPSHPDGWLLAQANSALEHLGMPALAMRHGLIFNENKHFVQNDSEPVWIRVVEGDQGCDPLNVAAGFTLGRTGDILLNFTKQGNMDRAAQQE